MKIIETILFEYVLGYILQGFTFIFGIYAFNRHKIDKKFLIASILLICISFIMRLLPISFGIHTILDLICVFLLAILFLKMPAFESIRSLLLITILLLVTEFLNVFLMTNIIGQAKFDSLMNDNLYKAILGLPATILFALLIVISYIILVYKKKKSEEFGKGSK